MRALLLAAILTGCQTPDRYGFGVSGHEGEVEGAKTDLPYEGYGVYVEVSGPLGFGRCEEDVATRQAVRDAYLLGVRSTPSPAETPPPPVPPPATTAPPREESRGDLLELLLLVGAGALGSEGTRYGARKVKGYRARKKASC